jgi:chorismate mutase
MDSHPDPAAVAPRAATLAEFRAEIDRIDDAIHDLLMRRAGIVHEVRGLGKPPYRPGREASMVRRLLGRNQGHLPGRGLVMLWRQVFAAHLAVETAFLISVCDTSADCAYAAAAREHYGALTPLRVHRSAAQAMTDVRSHTATAAVLPMPVEEEPAPAAWWVALLHRDAPRLHVVARLPFWARPRGEGAVSVQALVLSTDAPDPSGHDRALLGFEAPHDTSRASLNAALAAAGIVPGHTLLRRDAAGGPTYGLIDLEGHMRDDDPRLAALAGVVHRPVVLGGYANPVEAA